MAETKKITTLHVVVDTENSYDVIGDIDGGMFDEQWLSEYIQNYGSGRLLNRLAYMTYQVIQAERNVLKETLYATDECVVGVN
jgi:hypothetical protein